MANINTNYGFDKCGSFEEIAMLALQRTLDINDTGLARVNIRITAKQIDVYFYRGSDALALYYCHGTIMSGFCNLSQFDEGFKKFELIGKEACHA